MSDLLQTGTMKGVVSASKSLGGKMSVPEIVYRGGTGDHAELANRDIENQHPIEAITGLREELDDKQPKGEYLAAEDVPEWAMSEEKPSYTADEVNALPNTTKIPAALADLSEDVTHRVVTDKQIEEWNGKSDFSGDYNDLDNIPKPVEIPVQSVNGKKGEVQLSAEDVNALPNTTEIPDTLADLMDDAEHRTVTDSQILAWNAKSEFSGRYEDLTGKPTIPTVPVQSVNGKTGAVQLNYEDVGAHPVTWMPSADDVNARPNTWMPSAKEVGADAAGTAQSKVQDHNTSEEAHNDIRLELQNLKTQIDTLLDSDDATLDQMSEVVAYIKNNKNLIDGITTGKVNVADIINNLNTNAANKPLSAAQGVVLKALIDAIVIPTKLSELANDKGYLTEIPSEYVTEAELSAKKYLTAVPSEYVTDTELTAKGYITDYTETDPTVPEWAKAATKPSYTNTEVGLGNVKNERQYSANNPPPYPVTSVNGKTGAVTLSIPDSLSDLAADSTHRTVTDTEKATWNGKLSASELGAAVDDALAQAKASGEFNGADGERGTGILKITTAPSSYTTATGGFTPTYRVALSTVKSQAKVDKVLVGDTVAYNYYQYLVGYVDASYVYLGARTSVRGAAGTTPVKGTDYYTEADKADMVAQVIAALPVYNGGVA